MTHLYDGLVMAGIPMPDTGSPRRSAREVPGPDSSEPNRIYATEDRDHADLGIRRLEHPPWEVVSLACIRRDPFVANGNVHEWQDCHLLTAGTIGEACTCALTACVGTVLQFSV